MSFFAVYRRTLLDRSQEMDNVPLGFRGPPLDLRCHSCPPLDGNSACSCCLVFLGCHLWVSQRIKRCLKHLRACMSFQFSLLPVVWRKQATLATSSWRLNIGIKWNETVCGAFLCKGTRGMILAFTSWVFAENGSERRSKSVLSHVKSNQDHQITLVSWGSS